MEPYEQKFNQEIHTPELVEAAETLNYLFEGGMEAWEVIDLLKEFPRPILIDFNETLVGFKAKELIAAPYAKEALHELDKIGNIFIVTVNDNPKGLREILENIGLWKDNFVLMPGCSWEFIMYAKNFPEAGPVGVRMKELDEEEQENFWVKRIEAREKLLIEFNKFRGNNLFSHDYINHIDVGAAAMKKVAPLFGKKFDLPLIDDSKMISFNNPGIIPLIVHSYLPNNEPKNEYSQRRMSLPEAVEKVKEYYSKF